MPLHTSWSVLLVLGVFILCGCATEVTEEQMQANRDNREIRIERARVEERKKLADALQDSDVLTVRLQSGVRIIVTDVVLNTDEWCAYRLASRGVHQHNDFWIEYDQLSNGPQHACLSYVAVKSVRVGDARVCEGLRCLFN